MKRHAFTLIELLVVVAVLSILAGLLFPVFAAARDAARQSTCLSNLRQLALAEILYQQDYDEVLPQWYQWTGTHYAIWPEYLQPYYGSAQILDQTSAGASHSGPSWLADYVLLTWGPGVDSGAYWCWPGACAKTLAEVRRPAESMSWTDGETTAWQTRILWLHGRRTLLAAFLDGHAHLISDLIWNAVDKDERGAYFRVAAADR